MAATESRLWRQWLSFGMQLGVPPGSPPQRIARQGLPPVAPKALLHSPDAAGTLPARGSRNERRHPWLPPPQHHGALAVAQDPSRDALLPQLHLHHWPVAARGAQDQAIALPNQPIACCARANLVAPEVAPSPDACLAIPRRDGAAIPPAAACRSLPAHRSAAVGASG